MNLQGSHLLRRRDRADKTGGLALPITPFLRDIRHWFASNGRKEVGFELLIRRHALK